MSPSDRPLVWLHGEIQVATLVTQGALGGWALAAQIAAWRGAFDAPFQAYAVIGSGCHELRINDRDGAWRVIYRIDADAIVIVAGFQKQTNQTPQQVIDTCRQRLSRYDADSTG